MPYLIFMAREQIFAKAKQCVRAELKCVSSVRPGRAVRQADASSVIARHLDQRKLNPHMN